MKNRGRKMKNEKTKDEKQNKKRQIYKEAFSRSNRFDRRVPDPINRVRDTNLPSLCSSRSAAGGYLYLPPSGETRTAKGSAAASVCMPRSLKYTMLFLIILVLDIIMWSRCCKRVYVPLPQVYNALLFTLDITVWQRCCKRLYAPRPEAYDCFLSYLVYCNMAALLQARVCSVARVMLLLFYYQ